MRALIEILAFLIAVILAALLTAGIGLFFGVGGI
jgi:hypothetical protein